MSRPRPQPVSVFDAADDAAEEKAWAEAEADIAAGRVVPHGKVKRWLLSWGMPDELPAPRWRKRK